MEPRQTETSPQASQEVKGLPMFTASAPEALAQERAELAALEDSGVLRRWRGYAAKTGPGWLQSALVLGSGSAMASLFAGAYLEYRLLPCVPGLNGCAGRDRASSRLGTRAGPQGFHMVVDGFATIHSHEVSLRL